MHALRDVVVDRMGAALVERGWQRWGDASDETPRLTLSRPGDIVCSIGLASLARSYGGVEFSPTAGVTHVEVSRLSAVFAGHAWRGPGDSSLFGTTLATLVRAGGRPDQSVRGWAVDAESAVEPAVDDMLECIDTDGMAYLDGFRDLGDLISWMRADKGYQILVGKLAVALAVAGERDEAILTLRDYVAFVAQVPPGVLRDRTQAFVDAFAAHFGYGGEVAG
ncbi:hypothetical protein AB0J72_48180 [Dactylosporangium sp. NPDC049742]|uniref:hypothetical protein n=1 Tax=Dactylosporangium sp. NPDC049742 TaxID=3154737 RepID=UPI0034334083